MHGLARGALDMLFPQRCLGCSDLGSFFCPACVAALIPVSEALCLTCHWPVDPLLPQCACRKPALLCVRAVAEYRDPLRVAIHHFKYDGQRAAAPALGALLAKAMRPYTALDPLVVPIPLHASRMRQRGYNQSALIARAGARAGGFTLAETALRRVRATPPQVGLSTLARAENLTGAFAAQGALAAGRDILLVDDVCTTGATLRSAAVALHQAGARKVYAAVLAIAVGESQHR
jgi:ComF family protein